jgi:hypothetical protein
MKAHRTPKPLLYAFLSFLIAGSVALGIILFIAGYTVTFISPIIGGPLLAIGIYNDYKKEKDSRWRMKK